MHYNLLLSMVDDSGIRYKLYLGTSKFIITKIWTKNFQINESSVLFLVLEYQTD